jgi:hypothetical protein
METSKANGNEQSNNTEIDCFIHENHQQNSGSAMPWDAVTTILRPMVACFKALKRRSDE